MQRKQKRTTRWQVTGLAALLLLLVAACNEQPRTIPTPALVFSSPTPEENGGEATPLVVVVITPTPGEENGAEGEDAQGTAGTGAETPGAQAEDASGAQTQEAGATDTMTGTQAMTGTQTTTSTQTITGTKKMTDTQAMTDTASGGAPAQPQMSETELISLGEQVYAQNCARCHQLNGRGTSTYPALRQNENVTAEDPIPTINVIVHGQGQMPAFGETLTAQQIAAVVTHIRTSWDNGAAPVEVAQVQEVTGGNGSAEQAQTGASGAMTGTQTMTGTTAITDTGVVTPSNGLTQTTGTPTAARTVTSTAAPTATGTVTATQTVTATTTPTTTGSAAATPTPEAAATTATEGPPGAGDDKSTEEAAQQGGRNSGGVGPAPAAATPVSAEQLIELGQGLFTRNCAACHQAEGTGVAGAYPPLAGNPLVTAEDPTPLIQVVVAGRAGMPRFQDILSDQEIAATLSYARNSWENEATPASVEAVSQVRQSITGRTEDVDHKTE